MVFGKKLTDKELEAAVMRGREQIKRNKKRAKLRKELFVQKNPKLTAGVRAFKVGARVTGKGLIKGVTNLQKFAVERQDRLDKQAQKVRKVRKKAIKRLTPKVKQVKLKLATKRVRKIPRNRLSEGFNFDF